jgi:hypothetical protein
VGFGLGPQESEWYDDYNDFQFQADINQNSLNETEKYILLCGEVRKLVECGTI